MSVGTANVLLNTLQYDDNDDDELDRLPPPQTLPATQKRRDSTSNVKIGPFGHIGMSALIQACAEGDLAAVKAQLETVTQSEINSDRDDWAGSTCLHWAAYTGQPKIVRALLEAQADPTLHNTRYKEIPLHLAARYNHTPHVVELLASAAANTINTVNSKGNTPLHEAAYEGRAILVAELLRLGANVEAVNDPNARGGLTPLLAAVEYGHLRAVRALLEHGANTERKPMQARKMRTSVWVGSSRPRSQGGAGGRTPQRILASGRQAGTHHRIDLTPSSFYSDLSEFRLPGYGALSVAIGAGQLLVTSALLDHAVRTSGYCPPIFTREQVERVVRMWAIDQPGTDTRSALSQEETVHLFTLLVLCSRPGGAPPLRRVRRPPAATSTPPQRLLPEASVPSGAAATVAAAVRGISDKGLTVELPPAAAVPGVRLVGTLSGSGASFAGGDIDDDDDDSADEGGELDDFERIGRRPPNPVELALEIAAAMIGETDHFQRDRVVCDRLVSASTLLQHIASGLVEGAVRASDEKEEINRSFNPWRTGNDPVEPRIARDFFVRMSLPIAAEHELKVFVSNPFVYSHLVHLFWPEPKLSSRIDVSGRGTIRMPGPRAGHPCVSGFRDGALLAGMLVANLVALPLLLVIPRRWEIDLEERLREAIMSRQLPIGIVWFFPSGRFTLWCAATAALAGLVTNLPPPAYAEGADSSDALTGAAAPLAFLGGVSPIGITYADCLLGVYMCGWVLAEAADLLSTASWWFYIRDAFNVVDMVLIGGMLLTLGTRLATTSGALAGHAAEALMLPTQAVTAWLAWLRLLQVLFIFPKSGPLLIMTIRMLEDLWQFLMLAAFVLIAFGSAFYVLLQTTTLPAGGLSQVPHGSSKHDRHRALGELATASNGGEALLALEVEGGGGALSFLSVLTLLMEGTMDGEPDRIMGLDVASHVSGFTWFFMALFGIVVVLLLLNLLIARFAKTFDLIYENVDANFKVAFARVVLKGAGQELVPPPFNLIRLTVLSLYAAIAVVLRLVGHPFGLGAPAQPSSPTMPLFHGTDALSSPFGAATETPSSTTPATGGRPGLPRFTSSTGASYVPLDEAEHELMEECSLSVFEARKVSQFMRKATSPVVQLYPAVIEKWVQRHKYDVSVEERWRASIAAQIDDVGQTVRGHRRDADHAGDHDAPQEPTRRGSSPAESTPSAAPASQSADLEAMATMLRTLLMKVNAQEQTLNELKAQGHPAYSA